MYIYDTYAKIYMQSYYESFIVSIKTKIRDNFWMGAILFLYIPHVAMNVSNWEDECASVHGLPEIVSLHLNEGEGLRKIQIRSVLNRKLG